MNTSSIIKFIKKELKNQQVTYHQLARYLNMTEAGVKKLFGREDISLSKLNSICQLLNLSVSDFLKKAENDDVDVFSFKPKDINFFLNNPHYFHFFMKLSYEQKTPKEIQTQYKLTAKTITTYLKKLEELGLIKRHPLDRIQTMGGIPLAIKTNGTELEKIKYNIAIKILSQMQKNMSPDLKGAGLYLSDAELTEFSTKIQNIIIEYSNKSRVNRKSKSESMKDFTFMSFLSPESMFDCIIEL